MDKARESQVVKTDKKGGSEGGENMTDIFLAIGEILLFIMIMFLFHERQLRRWTVKTRKFYNDFKKGRTK